MKDMIKRIREEREGFTLAELLIVVAIIAVLVAIAIPVFNSQLEKSREAVDLSNIRAAYAECTTAVLTGEKTGNADGVNPGTTEGSYSKKVELQQKSVDWTGDNKDVLIANVKVPDISTDTKFVTVTVDKDGKLTMDPSNN